MVNNANGLGPLHRPIPMMPPSRNMPNQEGTKIVNGDVRRPEVRNIGSGNWTGRAARAGRAAKAGHVARAANGVRVGNAPRVTDVTRAGHAVSMRYRNQECGCPNGDGVRARGTMRKIGPASCRVLVHIAMSRPEVLSTPSIWCPLATNYRSSSS